MKRWERPNHWFLLNCRVTNNLLYLREAPLFWRLSRIRPASCYFGLLARKNTWNKELCELLNPKQFVTLIFHEEDLGLRVHIVDVLLDTERQSVEKVREARIFLEKTENDHKDNKPGDYINEVMKRHLEMTSQKIYDCSSLWKSNQLDCMFSLGGFAYVGIRNDMLHVLLKQQLVQTH